MAEAGHQAELELAAVDQLAIATGSSSAAGDGGTSSPAAAVPLPASSASTPPVAAGLEVLPPQQLDFLQVAPLDPAVVYLDSLGSAESRRTMGGNLDRLASLLTGRSGTAAATIPWHLLRPEHTTAIRAKLLADYAPSTARKMLSALSGVFRQCWRLQLMTRDDYERVTDWGSIDGTTLAGHEAGRHVATGELRALFASCADDPRPTGARDAAVLAVMFGAGLRRGEAVALDLDAYQPASGHLTVDGKGNRTRVAYCGDGGRAAIESWIQIRGDRPGPLLVAVNKAGRIDPACRRLTTTALYGILQRRATAADVGKFSPHDLRRTFAGELFDAGADLSAVQQLMGHARASTTTSYDRRPAAAKARAAGLIHVPYVMPDQNRR